MWFVVLYLNVIVYQSNRNTFVTVQKWCLKWSFYGTVLSQCEPTAVMCINRGGGVFVFLLMVHSLLRVRFLVCFGHRLSDIRGAFFWFCFILNQSHLKTGVSTCSSVHIGVSLSTSSLSAAVTQPRLHLVLFQPKMHIHVDFSTITPAVNWTPSTSLRENVLFAHLRGNKVLFY